MTAAFDGIPRHFSSGPYISLNECWSTGEREQWEGLQQLKDKRNHCQRSDGLWGTGAGGSRKKPEEETDEKRKKFQQLHERRLLHLWRRLMEVGRAGEEREGGGGGIYRPHWNDARAKKKEKTKQTK